MTYNITRVYIIIVRPPIAHQMFFFREYYYYFFFLLFKMSRRCVTQLNKYTRCVLGLVGRSADRGRHGDVHILRIVLKRF